MWKVGTLVQPGFKPDDFFFNHFSTKRKFLQVSVLRCFLQKRCFTVWPVFMHCLILKNIPIVTRK